MSARMQMNMKLHMKVSFTALENELSHVSHCLNNLPNKGNEVKSHHWFPKSNTIQTTGSGVWLVGKQGFAPYNTDCLDHYTVKCYLEEGNRL